MNSIINIVILYPSDPCSPLIGGIESFIRGLILNSPKSIRYCLVGVTTDVKARPVGRWVDCQIGDIKFKLFPLYAVKYRGKRSLIPATIIYELAALFRMPDLVFADVIESHRIEHLLFHHIRKPFNLFLHQNMAELDNSKSDILWKFAPKVYRFIERIVFKREGSIFCVREDAVNAYKRIYPMYSDKFKFQPTWMDEKVFFPVSSDVSSSIRYKLCDEYMLDYSQPLALTVGRIDLQKDPFLMVRAIASVHEKGQLIQVIWIGDGVLKAQVMKKVKQLNLESRFKFAGLKDSEYIANAIRGCDFFLMSSAYEGMPIAVLESLACGRPIVSTCVGEVPRLISNGENGFLAKPGDVSSLSSAIINMIKEGGKCTGKPCLDVAIKYRSYNVLQNVYRNYYKLLQ